MESLPYKNPEQFIGACNHIRKNRRLASHQLTLGKIQGFIYEKPLRLAEIRGIEPLSTAGPALRNRCCS